MASLITILNTVGADLKVAEGWVSVGIKAAEPIVGVVDPLVLPILMEAEAVLSKLFGAGTVTAAQVQAVVTSTASGVAIRGGAATPPPASDGAISARAVALTVALLQAIVANAGA